MNDGRRIAAFAQRRQGRSKSGCEGAGGFAELERRSPVHALASKVVGELREARKGFDDVGGIVATGFPNGSLERATNKGDGAITAGLLAATGPLGGDKKRPVLATAGVVVEVNRVLNEGAGQIRLGQHLGQTGLTSLEFRNRHAPVFAVRADDVRGGPRGHDAR